MVPDDLDILKASEHLVTHTAQHPGIVLDFDTEAKDMFDSYQVMFNTRCHKLRKLKNADQAAEEGTACVLSHSHCRCCVLILHSYICISIVIYKYIATIHRSLSIYIYRYIHI